MFSHSLLLGVRAEVTRPPSSAFQEGDGKGHSHSFYPLEVRWSDTGHAPQLPKKSMVEVIITPSLFPLGSIWSVTMVTPHPLPRKKMVEFMITPYILPYGGEMQSHWPHPLPPRQMECIYYNYFTTYARYITDTRGTREGLVVGWDGGGEDSLRWLVSNRHLRPAPVLCRIAEELSPGSPPSSKRPHTEEPHATAHAPGLHAFAEWHHTPYGLVRRRGRGCTIRLTARFRRILANPRATAAGRAGSSLGLGHEGLLLCADQSMVKCTGLALATGAMVEEVARLPCTVVLDCRLRSPRAAATLLSPPEEYEFNVGQQPLKPLSSPCG